MKITGWRCTLGQISESGATLKDAYGKLYNHNKPRWSEVKDAVDEAQKSAVDSNGSQQDFGVYLGNGFDDSHVYFEPLFAGSNPTPADAKAEFFRLLGGKQKKSRVKYYQDLFNEVTKVALSSGQIVTFVDSGKDSGRLHFDRVEVPKKYRGTGLAKSAVKDVIDAADAAGITLSLTVSVDREDMPPPQSMEEDVAQAHARERDDARLIKTMRSFGFITNYELRSLLTEQTTAQMKALEKKGHFFSEMIRYPAKSVLNNPPTILELSIGLRRAKAARDSEAVAALSAEIKRLRGR